MQAKVKTVTTRTMKVLQVATRPTSPKTDKGDKDYTWRKGGESKTHGGLNKEGVEATDELVEQITKRVAARILKSALAKK